MDYLGRMFPLGLFICKRLKLLSLLLLLVTTLKYLTLKGQSYEVLSSSGVFSGSYFHFFLTLQDGLGGRMGGALLGNLGSHQDDRRTDLIHAFLSFERRCRAQSVRPMRPAPFQALEVRATTPLCCPMSMRDSA